MHPIIKHRMWLPTRGDARQGRSKTLAFCFDQDLNTHWENARRAFDKFRVSPTEANREITRQAVIGYLGAAEYRKSEDYRWIPWYDFYLRYLTMILRNFLVAVVITLSLVLSVAHAITEGYPKGVKKPTELVIFTAIAVTIKLAAHIAMYMLAAEPSMFRKYGRATVVATGCVSAGLKGIECILICVLVDGKIPEDNKGRFSMCALAFAEGLLAVAAGMAFTGPEVVAFDSPGDVFDGFGSRSRFPRLTIQEKRILIEAVIVDPRRRDGK